MQAIGLVVLVLGVIAVVTARKNGASLGGAFTGGAALFIACGSISILVSIVGNIAVILKLRPLLVIVRILTGGAAEGSLTVLYYNIVAVWYGGVAGGVAGDCEYCVGAGVQEDPCKQ